MKAKKIISLMLKSILSLICKIKSVDSVGYSHKVYGELTIKGISNPIDFNAQISVGK